MGIVKKAIEEIDSDVLRVKRDLLFIDIYEIKELLEKDKTTGTETDPLSLALEKAYKFGFWMGYRHCEVDLMDD